MESLSPPPPPSSFDPAIHLHSKSNDPVSPSNRTDSDDIEALILQNEESIAKKTSEGVVIQHRSWKLQDAFRSDEDHQERERRPSNFQAPVSQLWKLRGISLIIRTGTPSKTPLPPKFAQCPTIRQSIPSSPPFDIMGFVSSPVAYPPSSSPPAVIPKRKSNDLPTSPLAKKRRITDTLVEEDDDPNTTTMSRPKDAGTGDGTFDYAAFKFDTQLNPLQKSNNSNDLEQDSAKAAEPLPTLKKQFFSKRMTLLRTCSGKSYSIATKSTSIPLSYEKLVAERSTTAPGRAQKSYYGIEIHKLLDDARTEIKKANKGRCETLELPVQSVEKPLQRQNKKSGTMWTEKYRARKFTDLVGDERTHRSVLRWLKGWDSIVFPGLAQTRLKKKAFGEGDEDRSHRKILLLTGPPGLGKTTLAHVCARQAGYEVLEINASDERSKDIVKGRIKDAVGTENVKGVNVDTANGRVRKAGRPVCVIVDEVDGVVGGSGGSGEGGFMKALIDLVLLDQRNSGQNTTEATTNPQKRRKNGEKFRMLRPLILICNDVYHPSLRPFRASTIAEIIHIRKPPLDKVVQRMKDVFEKEGILSDGDAVRRLCESTWGLGGRKEGRAGSRGSGEGDIRGVLVAGEWLAHKLRSSASNSSRLTRKLVDQHLQGDPSQGDSPSQGVCRGGVREIVERVFLDGAGFPNALSSSTSKSSTNISDPNPSSNLNPANLRKRHAISRLREMVDTIGDHDRCVTDCFSQYPSETYQDDTFLSKPNAAYDWLHFHDLASSKVFARQEWELTPYLSQSVLAFHHLFAAVGNHSWNSEKKLFDKDAKNEAEAEPSHPFSGARADFAAYEAEKAHRATLTSFQSALPTSLLRSFRSPDAIATDLLPQVMRMLSPDVKPVVVGGGGDNRGIASVRKESEKCLVKHGARVMHALGITFERARVESEPGNYGGGGWIFRMEP
jgi:chromosome transmission fidelity protein 18